MALIDDYSLFLNEDYKYVLCNSTGVSFNYFLSYIDCSGNTSELSSGILANSCVELINSKFCNIGKYKLVISNITENITVYFYNYIPVILSISSDVENIICDCNICNNECEDCNKNQDYINLYNKILSLLILNRTSYHLLLPADQFLCLIEKELMCTISNEYILGKVKNSNNLIKILIIYMYLLFYKIDQANTIYMNVVDKLYNIKVIKKCLNNYGIMIPEELDIIVGQLQDLQSVLELGNEASLSDTITTREYSLGGDNTEIFVKDNSDPEISRTSGITIRDL